MISLSPKKSVCFLSLKNPHDFVIPSNLDTRMREALFGSQISKWIHVYFTSLAHYSKIHSLACLAAYF
jgi:hypothetical protein